MVIDKAMKKALTPVFNKIRQLTILEIGCGIGRWTEHLAEGNSVIGVDLSRIMAKTAKERCKGKECSFVVADVSYLPFKESICDLVVSITVLQHILDKKRHFKALTEIARCSRSRALLVEEMWSDNKITLGNVYCPIQIVPVKSYVEDLSLNDFKTQKFTGVTPAVLTVSLTRLLAKKRRVTEGTLNVGVKSSKLLSFVVHFIMGVGTFSAVFPLTRGCDPHNSLHTIMFAEKRVKQ